MTDEQKAAYINAQCVAANAGIQGMIAENQQRIHRGESLAYTEDAFNLIPREYGLSHNQVCEFFGEE